ncbi:CRISPR-associated helicase/endonuclease Cas3 [Musicola paradisiaca]|uniref:CRISPR-associated helicase Cas3 n=1 Tax=Musicola paradisiaca (strain Ech703) TaxID=579405 RepID=C6C422_MUSP7|nr:CRISPR-associated helicase/endonuclease Cas3 [Musicola paradisiaca]ACS87349.1 CRISPR-associated helicase Cas3 [Musicola paradisiaca Ech703]
MPEAVHVELLSAPYFHYWGKAQSSSENENGAAYHLLPYHGLDVAACGYWLVKHNRFHARDHLQALGLHEEHAALWLAWFLAWHDIGKFARGFQRLYQNPDAPLVQSTGQVSSARHDSLGLWLWRYQLYDRWQQDADWLPTVSRADKFHHVMDLWLRLMCGHHGQPPVEDDNGALAFHPDDILAAQAYLTDLRTVFPELTAFPDTFSDRRWRALLQQQSWPLAGCVVLADWIGSSQADFPYHAGPLALADYWHQHALPQAESAVLRLPAACHVAPFQSMNALFPFITQPTPLQQQAMSVDINTPGPQLFLLEDVTGAGKTEAALVLTHRLLSAGFGDGVYVGLPTMATANAMYRRLATAYRMLFNEPGSPSLMLAHGARDMVTDFQLSLWAPEQTGPMRYGPDENSASAACNQWFADSRKKALLADVGVGTLDQALMAVMPFRHQSLRLLGFNGKILLLDEVHAYDAYTSRLLENLLAFHASQGGSAIILTATLAASQRERLVQAFYRGVQQPPGTLAKQAGYPWFTQVNVQALHEWPLATRAEVCRTVAVDWLSRSAEAIALIRRSVAAGQCVCWIRNTVDDAIAAWRQLCQCDEIAPDDVLLFHSRFAFCDRLAIEDTAVERFGKHSDGRARRGKVLIATQVVEQSLDIDVDVMISDLAPVDLLIQRAGRLQRHIRRADGGCKRPDDAAPRQDDRPAPVLWVLAPEWQPDAGRDWLGAELRGTGAVYSHQAVLWRTQAILRERGALRMPEEARLLIDSVYEQRIAAPAALEAGDYQAEGKQLGDRTIAAQSSLTFSLGYCAAAAQRGWSDDAELFTRAGEDSLDVYLAWRADHDDALPRPYAGEGEFGWEKSRLSVRRNWWRQHEKQWPTLQGEARERFRQQLHRPGAEVLLLTPGEAADYYHADRGLVAR